MRCPVRFGTDHGHGQRAFIVNSFECYRIDDAPGAVLKPETDGAVVAERGGQRLVTRRARNAPVPCRSLAVTVDGGEQLLNKPGRISDPLTSGHSIGEPQHAPAQSGGGIAAIGLTEEQRVPHFAVGNL